MLNEINDFSENITMIKIMDEKNITVIRSKTPKAMPIMAKRKISPSPMLHLVENKLKIIIINAGNVSNIIESTAMLPKTNLSTQTNPASIINSTSGTAFMQMS